MTLADEYRHVRTASGDDPPTGLNALVDGLAGGIRRLRPVLPALRREAEAVLELAEGLRALDEAALAERIAAARTAYRRRPAARETLAREALALVVEAADRTLGMRPYAVQLVGALAIHRNFAAQMATGEGKTLTVCLPAVLAAWTGRPCHVVTANDYLAARDAEQMAPLYAFCHVSVGAVGGGLEPAERREHYRRDVVYATSKELAADFLRDRLGRGGVSDPDRLLTRRLAGGEDSGAVMRGLHTAIVDEADSVLIDEAAVPLIISFPGRNDVLKEASLAASRMAQELEPGADYIVDERHRHVEWTTRGEERIAALTETLPPIWRSPHRREELLRKAIVARAFYTRDRHYVIQDDKIVIVDELTGRLMEGRTWSYGLHQAVEAKEGVPISEPSETCARLSFQRFFRLYHRLGGLSGTLQGIGGELWRIYRLPVVRVPTRLPLQRRALPPSLFPTAAAKWDAVEEEVLRVHAEGRPVLVGTRSIVASEELARRLRARGVECAVLNALHAATEASIVAEAGHPGRVTIATNMAGRGTDVRLPAEVLPLGGLHVVATERHEARRVDNQLYGRCSRQGQPGTTRDLISLDDEIPRSHLPQPLRRLLQRLCAGPGGQRLGLAVYALAQRWAEHVSFRQRRQVMQTDSRLDEILSFHTE